MEDVDVGSNALPDDY